MGFGPNRIASFPDAVAQILERYLAQTDEEVTDMEPSAGKATIGHHNGNGNGHVQMSLGLNGDTTHDEVPVKELNPYAVGDICPDCGSATLMKEEGCVACHSCGYSEC